MMYERPLEEAVVLCWHTTPGLREANYYGLREQIIQAQRLDHRRIHEVLPSRGYHVIGRVEESDEMEARLSELETLRHTHYINMDALDLLVYDLFRQGYIGTGFYIIDFDANALPIETSNP
jgi:hypothetical protein